MTLPATALTNIPWRPVKQWPQQAIPAVWRHWLLDRGSLTQRLIEASDNHFAVAVIRQELGLPRLDEARALGITGKRQALVREVFLLGHNQSWVFARSIIPLSTLSGRLRSLRHLDNRPLGALLFSDPTMTRGPLEIARIPGSLIPADGKSADQLLWGRRSVFYLDRKPLLVSEIFLAGFTP